MKSEYDVSSQWKRSHGPERQRSRERSLMTAPSRFQQPWANAAWQHVDLKPRGNSGQDGATCQGVLVAVNDRISLLSLLVQQNSYTVTFFISFYFFTLFL